MSLLTPALSLRWIHTVLQMFEATAAYHMAVRSFTTRSHHTDITTAVNTLQGTKSHVCLPAF